MGKIKTITIDQPQLAFEMINKTKKKKKKPRARSQTAKTSAEEKGSSLQTTAPDSSGNDPYAIGQIAGLLTSQKGQSDTKHLKEKDALFSMFGSVGSTSGPTCRTRPAFVPLTAAGLPKTQKTQGQAKDKEPPKQTGSTNQKQQPKQEEQQPPPKAVKKPSPQEKPAEKSKDTGKEDSTPKRHKPNPEELKKTVFVGNLPISFDKKKLQKLFRKFGEIKTMRFRSVAPSDPDLPKRVIAHTKQFHADRKSVNSYILFTTEEAAQKALKRNGKLVENHTIRVDLAGNSREHDTKHSIFLGNLPFDVKDDVVREHFEECGTVENVRIIRDAKTGLGKGFGYVLFTDDVSVEFAIKLDGSRMAGRDIRVQRATKQKQRAVNAVKRLQKKSDVKGKPDVGRRSHGKPVGVKPGQVKPGRGQPGRGQPGRGKPGRAKPAQGKLTKPKSGQPRSSKGGRGSMKKGKASGGIKKFAKSKRK
ncbi:RNA-binding protein 34-like [Asterias rubens]|uniref:RNA-binding protein 34-like n=1 Tax=Asterias rubens TaxID=7604 RepID=UPI001455C329|nr:RNA-binding protein 34-like [Asterias rubens]